MQNEESYYLALLSGFIYNKLSVDEVKELLEFIQSQPSQYDHLLNSEEIKNQLSEQAYNSNIDISEAMSARMKERLMAALQDDETGSVVPADPQVSHESKPLFRVLTSHWRWIAAASILIAVTIAVFMMPKQPLKDIETVTVANTTVHDVLPGGNKATLRLANGQIIILDSAANGSLAIQGNAKVVKLADGQIAYTIEGKADTEVMYNTMSTPRGGQYKLKLPDGTDVWLNAASSITYPTAFVGNNRTVSITGEAYFEVTNDKSKPFHVKVNDMDVEVLGTHFNINAYADEGDIKTTLLEGSVKVGNRQSAIGNMQSAMLKPGQQAVLTADSRITIHEKTDADLEAIIAWKNGLFNFNMVSLQEVMKQIARWYDVDVEYQGQIRPKKFGGEIQRDLNLSEVLEGLKQTGVHFRIEGKKLIVLP